jgi:C4-dicarboxylate transporter DctM subunit
MFASLFSFVLITQGAPQALIALINQVTTNKIVILLLINIFLLFAGCFLDASSAIIVLTPLLLPLVRSIGMDYTHFGVIMIVNLAIGLITPPVGLDLYVACSIAKISLEDICKAVWPFLAVSLVVLMLVTYIPGLSLWLPSLLGY